MGAVIFVAGMAVGFVLFVLWDLLVRKTWRPR